MPNPYEVAARRFELIAFLIDPSLNDAQRRAAWRERSATVGQSTIYRWLRAYRESGYIALLPKPRADRGRARKAGVVGWIGFAIGLLYEQPDRSLTQIEVYLRAEFADFALSRTTLHRHLRQHPAYTGIARLRSGKKSKLRDLYEAGHPHEGWQLDGKGPFKVRLLDGRRIEVHVLSVLDDHSRAILAAIVALAEDTEAAVKVTAIAIAKWGLADRFQFDRGSAFDSKAFRGGLAALGVHRNFVRSRSPEWEGKVEAYHRCLGRWFVRELRAQQVVDLDHLQQLLEAVLALVYNRHHHSKIGTTPEKRLANRTSDRRVSQADLERVFFVEIEAKSDPKTGEVRLPSGSYRVPSVAYAGQRSRFRYHPTHEGRAVLVTRDGREIELQLFVRKPLSAVEIRTDKRGVGRLQKLVDLWQGKERPNAQPGFGVPEVFKSLGELVVRDVPDSEHEAHAVLAFYRKYGPLPRDAFESACARTKASLGTGRALRTYLADLERQIGAQRGVSVSDPEEKQS
jgi:putative transposase